MSTYPNTLESILGPNLDSILAELEEIYPPITPNPDETMEKIMYRSGTTLGGIRLASISHLVCFYTTQPPNVGQLYT